MHRFHFGVPRLGTPSGPIARHSSRSALEGLFKFAQVTIMARKPFSLVNASGNGPRRHWKTDHGARPRLLEHDPARSGAVSHTRSKDQE
jgi:hypothetical protein